MGRTKRQIVAQATVEFTFAMIAVIFLIYGMVRVFRWAGMELAERRVAHDRAFGDTRLTAEQQLNPEISRVTHIDAVFHGNIIK